MKRRIFIILILIIFVIIFLKTVLLTNKGNIIEVHIGYQSVTSQTWGALIVKNKKIFENKLKKEYPDKKIKVVWHDEISGSVINTNMVSNKFDFGFMGDMPLLLNMHKSNTINNYDSLLIAFDGKGISGKNQSIVTMNNNGINDVQDLKGKTVSTPIGSSAHFMLMKVLKKYNLLDDVTIVHQDVAMASQLLTKGKTDAFAIWEPYPSFLTEEFDTKILADGTESDIDYLAGVMVNKKMVEKNHKIVELFIESLEESHEFINNNPKEAAKIFSEESGFNYNISLKVAKNILWDCSMTEENIKTLNEKKTFLIDLDQIEDFNLDNNIYK